MSRAKGLSAFSANFEPQMASPLDARMLVDTVADLTIEAVWQAADDAVYAYKGMIVSVCNDTEENNGVYRLVALPVTIADNWVKLGSGSGLTWYPDDDPPAEPKKGDAYYDTVQGKSVVWDGAAWQTVAADGIQGLPGTAGADGTTPHIDEATGNWFIGETNTEIPATGPAGQDGANGVTPHVGLNGNWFIGETDTEIPATGPAGQDGEDGADGITPHIDVGGNWFIGLTDTGISAQGPAGNDGQDGADGYNGVTPHIDEATGNWFIGETDTGIPARGLTGEDGSDGTDGVSITWLGTLAAPPDSPQQNQAYYNSTDKKAYIYNIEDAVGTWEIIAQDGVDTFPVVYSNEDPSVVGAGGILPGTTFTNITFPQFMNMLLYPELFPTELVAPSFTFTPDKDMGFREVGEVISSIVFTTAFDRGAINPQYQSESPYRSGPPNQYIYTGTGLTTATKTDLSDVQTVTDYTVIAGLQGWTAAVAHDDGVQPKSSDGTNYGSPYPAGTLSAIEQSIVGVYPFFATTANTFSFTKQPLAAMDSAYVETAMAVETDAYKQAVDFPVGWSAIVGIQAYNTAFEKWEWICGSAAESLATFTQSSVSRTVNGNSVNYTRYTHNGVRIGSRQLRWYTTLG